MARNDDNEFLSYEGLATRAYVDSVVSGLTPPITVANGGTGLTTLTPYALLAGGTTPTGVIQQVTALGSSGQVLTSNGVGALPTFQAAPGGAPSGATYITQIPDAGLSAEQALSALATGFLSSTTATGVVASRTLVAPVAGLTIANNDGASGNPTFALADDLAALEAMASTGIVARTAANTYAQRTIVAGSAKIAVSNGNGVSGDPSIDLGPHAATHQDGGTDEISVTGLSGKLADAQPVTVRKNSGANIGTRARLNFIEGTNITLTVADDAGGDEVDVTIAAASGGGLNSGQTTVDFGSFPGKSDASVTITGQTTILSGSIVNAWILPAATADHSSDEHLVETLKVLPGNIIAGTGFTIYGVNYSQLNEPIVGGRGGIGTRLYGLWNVGWAWN